MVIFTDGSCIGNPGPGGYAAILAFRGREKEISEGFRLTTNNRMELLAVIAGLQALREPAHVTLHSDSQYVVKAMSEGWAQGWKARGWRRKDRKPVLNQDLWERLLRLCDLHRVTFNWVKGHAGHPVNERCDALALAAANGASLCIDSEYEKGVQ